jgi:hypothetical protein
MIVLIKARARGGNLTVQLEELELSDEKRAEILHEVEHRINIRKKALSDNDSPLRLMYVNKRDAILEWARDLETLALIGHFEKPINAIANYIRKEFIAMGLENSVAWIYESLPLKYKSHTPNPDDGLSTNGTQIPRLNNLEGTPKYIEENAKAIQLDQEVIEFLEERKRWLANHPFCSLLEVWEFNMAFARQTGDGRWHIPVAFQHLVNRLIDKVNINFATAVYGEKMKAVYSSLRDRTNKQNEELYEVSTKQFHKLGVGHIKELDPLLTPRNKQEAKQDDYWGTQCPNLHWTVDYKYNSDTHNLEYFCYLCDSWIEKQPIDLLAIPAKRIKNQLNYEMPSNVSGEVKLQQ